MRLRGGRSPRVSHPGRGRGSPRTLVLFGQQLRGIQRGPGQAPQRAPRDDADALVAVHPLVLVLGPADELQGQREGQGAPSRLALLARLSHPSRDRQTGLRIPAPPGARASFPSTNRTHPDRWLEPFSFWVPALRQVGKCHVLPAISGPSHLPAGTRRAAPAGTQAGLLQLLRPWTPPSPLTLCSPQPSSLLGSIAWSTIHRRPKVSTEAGSHHTLRTPWESLPPFLLQGPKSRGASSWPCPVSIGPRVWDETVKVSGACRLVGHNGVPSHRVLSLGQLRLCLLHLAASLLNISDSSLFQHQDGAVHLPPSVPWGLIRQRLHRSVPGGTLYYYSLCFCQLVTEEMVTRCASAFM